LTELGTRLKEARAAKGYSLEDLQDITKIQKRYLVGIEEGNYSSMPGSFYVRAFIKQYAEAVGLNPNEIFEQYQADIPNTQVTEVAKSYSNSHNRRTLAKATKNNKSMEAVPKIIVALFAIAIVVVVLTLIIKKVDEKQPIVDEDTGPVQIEKTPITKDPEEATKEEEPTEETEPTEEAVVVTQTISEGVGLSDGQSFEYNVTNTDQLNIRVEVIEGRSWIGMRDAAGTEQLGAGAKEYGAGEIVEFNATENQYVRIRLGRALNVKVYVNDEELQFVSDAITQNIIIKLGQTTETAQ
jgi:cytoskeletal protein RodZ